MKKLATLMIIITMLSCSKDEVCNCEKTSYEVQQYTYMENGLPRTGHRTVNTGISQVDCQEEGRTSTGSNTYYVINCN